MKIQLALDHTSIGEALSLLEKTADMVDIVEAGTPLILAEGIRAVREIVARYPGLPVLADLKIMDAGDLEARIALDAGAAIVTVLAAAEDVTIRKACRAARAAGGAVMVDMIAVREIERRAAELSTLGADYLCCHTAYDTAGTGDGPLDALNRLRTALPAARLSVAGGITPERLGGLVPHRPEIVIVGGYVSGASDPRAALHALRAAAQAG